MRIPVRLFVGFSACAVVAIAAAAAGWIALGRLEATGAATTATVAASVEGAARETERVAAVRAVARQLRDARDQESLAKIAAQLPDPAIWPAGSTVCRRLGTDLVGRRRTDLQAAQAWAEQRKVLGGRIEAVATDARNRVEAMVLDVLIGVASATEVADAALTEGQGELGRRLGELAQVAERGIEQTKTVGNLSKSISDLQRAALRLSTAGGGQGAGYAIADAGGSLERIGYLCLSLPPSEDRDAVNGLVAGMRRDLGGEDRAAVIARLQTVAADLETKSTAIGGSLAVDAMIAVETSIQATRETIAGTDKRTHEALKAMSASSEALLERLAAANELRQGSLQLQLLLQRAAAISDQDQLRYLRSDLASGSEALLRQAVRLGQPAAGEVSPVLTRLLDDLRTHVAAGEAVLAAREASAAESAAIASIIAEVEGASAALAQDMGHRASRTQAEASAEVVRWRRLLVATAVMAGVMAMTIGWLIARGIVRPLVATREVIVAVAQGDLSRRVQVRGRDEMAEVGAALNATAEKLAAHQRQMDAQVDGMRQAALKLSEQSDLLTRTASGLDDLASSTASRAEGAAVDADRVSNGIATVNSAIEQMVTGNASVARSTGEAATIARQAAEQAAMVARAMQTLETASREIGSVATSIGVVTSKTRLLALNASIEAAKAGEAGRGFAVVAEEVKQLAAQTDSATSDVARRVTAIQCEVGAAITGIASIVATVKRIDELQHGIAAEVEEQVTASNEIQRAMAEAAHGSGSIAGAAREVASKAEATTAGAGDTKHAAEVVSELAVELRRIAEGG
jgi:methyl-accepting chemotaxis protein